MTDDEILTGNDYRCALINLLLDDAHGYDNPEEMLLHALAHGCVGWLHKTVEELEQAVASAFADLYPEMPEALSPEFKPWVLQHVREHGVIDHLTANGWWEPAKDVAAQAPDGAYHQALIQVRMAQVSGWDDDQKKDELYAWILNGGRGLHQFTIAELEADVRGGTSLGEMGDAPEDPAAFRAWVMDKALRV